MRLFLDLSTALWVSILAIALFFLIPNKIWGASEKKFCGTQAVSCFIAIVLAMVTGVALLTALRLFNWLTLMLWYGGCLLLGWLYPRRGHGKKRLASLFEKLIAIALDNLDRGLSWEKISKFLRRFWQQANKKLVRTIESKQLFTPQGTLAFIATIVVLSFTLLLRYELPLQELRLGHPDSYYYLLVTQQILASDAVEISKIPILSALAAIISLIGSIDPMQVVRFLGPLIGFLLVLSVGYCVRTLTKNGTAALVAMYSIGAYLFTWHGEFPDWLPLEYTKTIADSLNSSLVRQWAGGDLEIGTIFVLLAISQCWNHSERKYSKFVDIFSCLLIVAIAAPELSILIPIGLIERRLALALTSIIWLLLALLSVIPENPLNLNPTFLLTLPVGISLLSGLIFLAIAQLLFFFGKIWSEALCFILIFALSVNFFLPLYPEVNYLEYEITARKSLEIRTLFPKKRWVIVAPIEQLAQNYGAGWYEDLAQFVQKYADKVEKADFQFPFSVPDLFVFVEKRPFVFQVTRPQFLPYSVLSDHTYRYYRSTTGRAALQFEALQLCEAYLRTHSNASVYYEDDFIKIYRFPLAKEF